MDAAELKKKIREELRSVPDCVRNGGVMVVREYRNRVESATKLLNKPKVKDTELRDALYLLHTIDKYVPPHVPMTANGRSR